jgi:hypothetical protein
VPPTVDCYHGCGMTMMGKQCNIPLAPICFWAVYNRLVWSIQVFGDESSKTPYNDSGNSLEPLLPLHFRKDLRGTRLIAVPNGNNAEDWTIRG